MEAADLEMSIEQLDEELAHDVDELLQGSFESIDALLDDGPDGADAGESLQSENALSPVDEPPPPPEAPPEASPAAARDEPAEEEKGLLDPADFVSMFAGEAGAAPQPDPPDDEPQETDTAEAEPAAEDTPLPEGDLVPPEPDPPLEEPEPEPEPSQAETPLASARAESGDAAEDPGRGDTESERAPAGPSPVVQLLQWVNYPLRSMPPTGRVVVDWIALSLVFWGAIVWIFALVMVGG